MDVQGDHVYGRTGRSCGDHARWPSRGWPRRCVRCGGRGRRGTKEEAASLSRVSLPPCPCFWRLCADEKGGNLAGAGTTLAGFYIQCAEGWQGMWHAETGCAPARHTHGRSRTGRDAGPRGTGCGARHGGSIGRFTGVCSQGLRPGSRVVVVCSGVWWWGVGRWCACCACTDATAVVGGSVRWCRAVHMQARPCACRPGLRSLSRRRSVRSLARGAGAPVWPIRWIAAAFHGQCIAWPRTRPPSLPHTRTHPERSAGEECRRGVARPARLVRRRCVRRPCWRQIFVVRVSVWSASRRRQAQVQTDQNSWRPCAGRGSPSREHGGSGAA